MKPVFNVSILLMLFGLPVPGLSAQATPTETNAISCTKLNVNGVKPGDLTVSVNGTTVGAFQGEAGVYQDLESRMRPGINRVRLSFAAPGEPGLFGTEAELRCLPPGVETSRDTILRLKPTPKRLSAETDVNYVPR